MIAKVGRIAIPATDATSGTGDWSRYLPFGSQRPAAGTGTNPAGLPSDRLFTGQTRDLGNDSFYFFKSRYYDATIGKFQSPDSIVPSAGNPQTLNRYAYALNNPLKLVDPTGHFTVDQLKAWGYTQQQINNWKSTDPEWAALLAVAQVGDRVTGLDPHTSSSPVAIQGTFAVLPGYGRTSDQLVILGPARYANLDNFGQAVNTDRALWRPDGIGGGYSLIQTPHTFLRAPQAGDTTVTSNPGTGIDVMDQIHRTARVIRDVFTSNLDPFSPGPLNGQGTSVDIGIASAYDIVAAKYSPGEVGNGGTFATMLPFAAAAYDFAYHLAWGDN